MPPRLRLPRLGQPYCFRASIDANQYCKCNYATVATTPAASVDQMTTLIPPIRPYQSSQPPSHRPPEHRRSQLLREYVSLLQTTPLFLIFQHNNLKASEWIGIRRELNAALTRLDESLIAQGRHQNAIGSAVKLEIVRTNILEPALRIADYYQPPPPPPSAEPTDPSQPSSASGIPNASPDPSDEAFTHALSRQAHDVSLKFRNKHPLTPLLAGPVALLTFPSVSPEHIKAALQILASQAGTFPAPTRRAHPSYWELGVQDGLKKLMLLGARVDGTIFDMNGALWVGSIEGGIDGLRAQLVHMLQGFGAGITNALESGSRNLYFTMEGRKNMLEEEGKAKDESAAKE